MKVMTREAGDAKWAQMVPTESQILTESLIGMEISLGMMLRAIPKPNTGFESSPF